MNKTSTKETIGKDFRARKKKDKVIKKLIEISSPIFNKYYKEEKEDIVKRINCIFLNEWPISLEELIIEVTDYFPTYHSLTRIYLKEFKDYFQKKDLFLEPCAGAGDITKVLREFDYNNITEIDINPRRSGIKKLDFLKCNDLKIFDHTISNTPFKKSIDFFIKATLQTRKTISFLWPLDYLHGIDRFKNIFQKGLNDFKLEYCSVFIRRPYFDVSFNTAGPMPTGATTFAWFFFRKGFKGEWKGKHLDNSLEMGTPWRSDELTLPGL